MGVENSDLRIKTKSMITSIRSDVRRSTGKESKKQTGCGKSASDCEENHMLDIEFNSDYNHTRICPKKVRQRCV